MNNVKKKTMKVTIDENSGFCFGVIHAIEQAEYYLSQYNHLYCLGDLVHNNEEMKRLTAQGLEVISYDQFKNLTNTRVLIRAHGEAPEIYEIARQNKVELIDATCRVVLGLQKHIKKSIENEDFANGQILIFGKQAHAGFLSLTRCRIDIGVGVQTTKDFG